MKLILLSLIFISFFNLLFSQALKHYHGHFETKSVSGVASYSYIENANYERIYQGGFLFLSSNSLLKIFGNYKNDKKNGMWHFLASNFHLPSSYQNMGVKNVSFDIYGNYLDGNMEGMWRLKRTVTTVNADIVVENSTVNFKNNKLIGSFNFSFRCNNGNEYVVVKGTFDNDGNKIGEWVLDYSSNGSKYENLSRFTHDALTFQLTRNLSNGEILAKIEKGQVSGNYDQNSTIINKLEKIDVPIDFWVKSNDFYHGYSDLFMYAFSGLFSYNPIFEIEKGSNIDKQGFLMTPSKDSNSN